MFHTYKKDPAQVAPAAPGMVRWFAGTDGKPYAIDDAGVLHDFKGDPGEPGAPGEPGPPGLGGIPSGLLVVGDKDTTYEGLLRMDGSMIDPAIYPNVLGVCDYVQQIVSGDLVAPADILASAVNSATWSPWWNPQNAFDGVFDVHNGSAQSGWQGSWGGSCVLQAQILSGPKTVNAYVIYPMLWQQSQFGYSFEGSVDGESWVVLDSQNFIKLDTAIGPLTFTISQPGNYSYYRIVTPAGGNLPILSEVALYENAVTTGNYYLKNSNDIAMFPWPDASWFVKF